MTRPIVPNAPTKLGHPQNQLRTLERRDEDALGPPVQQLGEMVLALEQRLITEVIAIKRHDVEGVELSVVVVLARVT
jgi:hypothetical protein